MPCDGLIVTVNVRGSPSGFVAPRTRFVLVSSARITEAGNADRCVAHRGDGDGHGGRLLADPRTVEGPIREAVVAEIIRVRSINQFRTVAAQRPMRGPIRNIENQRITFTSVPLRTMLVLVSSSSVTENGVGTGASSTGHTVMVAVAGALIFHRHPRQR